MKRLLLIWIVGIALLGLEVSAMLWAKQYVRAASAAETSASAPSPSRGSAFPLSPF
ncbi:MAG: hypothetical protein R3200_14635 [Xanthomonadales bacterium]|nr:hypothetical protein [Xanthomonadales bacterium]